MSQDKTPSRRAMLVAASLAVSASLLAAPYIASADDASAALTAGTSGASGQTADAGTDAAAVSAAANELYDAAQQVPDTGYGSLVVSAKDHGYTLYWKGVVPPAVTSLIDSQRKKGIRVSVAASQHTFKELQDQARAITRSDARLGGRPVTGVGPSSDGSALDVIVAPAPGSAGAGLLDVQENDRAALESLAGGIPVNVSVGEAAEPIFSKPKMPDMTRFNDVMSWAGGSGIKSTGGYCTAGFSVIDPLTRTKYMTTAAHCVTNVGDVVQNGAKTATLGTVVDLQQSDDSALIKLDPSTTAVPVVYGEYGLGAPARTSRVVKGSGRAFFGEVLCTDGALMGEKCGGTVTRVAFWSQNAETKIWRYVDEINGLEYMAGSGDSGGPAYAGKTADPYYSVSARGVLSMTVGGGNCRNPIPGQPKNRPKCSNIVQITHLEDSLKHHAAALHITLRVDTVS